MPAAGEHVAIRASRGQHDRVVPAAGLLERVSCDTDRRGQWASLTDAGYDRLRSASPTHLRGVATHFLDRLSTEELSGLERTLARLADD